MKPAHVVGLICLLLASAAHADVTAVYKSKSQSFEMSMTLEIADNGDVRYQMSSGNTYGLVIENVDYFVEMNPKGPIVRRVSDIVTVQKEFMASFLRDMKPLPKSDGPTFVQSGKTMVQGREGRAYINASEAKAKEPYAVVVVSDDPKLAPLGRVMASQFSKSGAMMGAMLGRTPDQFSDIAAALRSGTAIRFAGMELTTVNDAKIDPKRFALPAQPDSIDQIRASLGPLPPPPTAAPEKP